jgi:hypothetical protein
MPGKGALVLRSIFLRCRFKPLFSESSLGSVMIGQCSETVIMGSFVARKLLMMFECSFCEKPKCEK